MPNLTLCPDRQLIERLRLGRLSQEQTAALDEHLLACERCCQALHELDLSDPLAETLRVVGARKPVIDDRVRAVMAHLKDVTLPGKAIEETMACTWEVTEDAWDLTRLLDPPEVEGELGRFGGYRVLRVLGVGGMGLVFEAEDPKLRRRVALKVMKRSLASHDEHHQRFLREARAAAAIEHPHIVTVYQVGEHKGLPFLAMQLLKGESLDDRLRREGNKEDGPPGPSSTKSDGLGRPSSMKGALPLAECLRIGRETAEALAEAHGRNLIHRDIKPGNIWLEGASGWVKLVDFGLAHAAEDVHLTQTGAILGTPAYMSPEQARGDAVDGRTDLYSLGAVLYKLTTGDVPFRGASTMAVLMALATETPRRPSQINPDIPPALDDLILRLLAKRPNERFASAAEVAEAIRAIEAELVERNSFRSDGSSPVTQKRNEFRSTTRRWPLVMAAAAAAFILVATVIIVRDKDGREVARVAVPEGGSFDTEQSAPVAKPAQGVSAPPNKSTAMPQTIADNLQRTTDREKPFVVVRAEGKERKEFKRFTEAIALLRDGDAIEIHGNGPFSIPRLRLDNKGLTVRAAPGYRPVLVAKDKLAYLAPWFEIYGGSITLDGCDFYSDDANWAFLGEGPQWEWRNCRFITHGGLASLPGPGQRLTIRDSLIWTIGSPDLQVIHCRSDTQIELVNNVVWTMNHGIVVDSASGGFKLTLARNTIFLGGSVGVRATWLSLPKLEANAGPLEVHADGNLFDLRLAELDGAGGSLMAVPDEATTRAAVEQRALRWQGRENLYCGPQGPVVQAGKERIEGLAAWRKFWTSDETGSIEPSDVSFTWDGARALHPPDAIDWLRQVVERAKQSEAKHLPDLGPDWDLIGPGDAYLRALAARGKPVAPADLRPEPTEEGPFVVVREGKTVGGHITLRQAVDAAENGDVIEIRAEGPFDGCDTAGNERGRTLVIRAAPGYLPVLESWIRYHAELTLEGIHFAAIEGDSLSGGNLHIVNCSFEENPKTHIVFAGRRDEAHPPEIVNCWLAGGAAIYLEPGTTASIRNSVVYRLNLSRFDQNQQGAGSFDVERSIIWNPGATVYGQRDTLSGNYDSLLTLKNTLLEGAVYPPMLNALGRKSSHNLYRTGVPNLVEWLRLKHNGGEQGSVAAPPLAFDGLQWGLLSSSPGFQAGPDGKDFGADVTRIGTLTALPSRESAALAAPSAEARETDNGKRNLATNPLDSRAPASMVVALDDERALGKWVVEQGGRVGTGSLCTVPIREIWLTDNGSISDDSLARFQRCPRLTTLDLSATAVSDQGLLHLSSLASLRQLRLRNTDGVGDPHYDAANPPTGPFGVRGIQVDPSAPTFGDAEMALLEPLRQLRFAHIGHVPITNRGLNCLKGLPKLEQFGMLGCPRVTGSGLAVLATLPRLRYVRVDGECGAGGLRHVLALANLESLALEGEIVGDDTLEPLAGLKQLQGLDLSATRVTGSGLARLAELPHLSSLTLQATNLSAADMSHLAELRGLESLTLARFPVSAEALRPLEKLTRLWHVALGNTSLDDGGFEAIGRLASLELVGVHDATDAGLAQIANLSRLRMLSVNGPTITDAGLERIARLPDLRMLDLGGAPQITDAGLAHLQGLATLETLRLAGTSVSESGVAAFKAALPGCNVEFPYGVPWQK
ncbi:MAG TPA: protein kinase [Pirellulales bacterium]|nr:protein kinase [Pirellulales bacterium]